ncbi:hypothetical protein K504DRAFT_457784 [Pleomassaria siparia CBS 279.74]|uniref:Uncharacterized protein n=1 Tax=Pleomassaria siparia CBS 279.74 TaxID=1314801 RepID=A0A6G1KTH9_9PLEO|nr:hypothetical protein K504DRAFT_457784 [Pleomassaria siparia CBS 279.74]
MSGLRDLAKGGWHPKGKDASGKESWKGDFKGVDTVAGWMGKGKDSNQERLNHQSAPLSTLKDPASFGPPPKRTLTRAPDSSGLGAPVPAPAPARQQKQAEREAEEEANKPSGLFRADTTGFSTAQLPKPPVFRPGQAPTPPPSRGPAAAKPTPKLPPRLPPRQNSHPDAYAEAPPPTYNEITHAPTQTYLNQSALDRLGQSGVSVPGFNIGRTASPPVPPRQNNALPSPSRVDANAPPSHAVGPGHGPQFSELQSRLARMATSSGEGQAPANSTNSFHNKPSAIVSTNLAPRGEQGAAELGVARASALGQKYGIGSKTNNAPPPMAAPL